MTTIVVGGHSRNVGKTSVTAGLIRAFNKYPWTAIKITSHWHGSTPVSSGKERENNCDIYEEVDREGASDTSRYLAAGASRALWVRIKDDPSDASLQQLLPILQSCPFAMIESNRILNVIQPDLFLMVLNYDVAEFKASARRALKQAHAAIVVNSNPTQPLWKGVEPEVLSNIPLFPTADLQMLPRELLDFVRSRLPR
jgi:hypothetical protein